MFFSIVNLIRFKLVIVFCVSVFFMLNFSVTVQAQQQSTPVVTDEVRVLPLDETVSVFGEIVSRQSGSVQVAINAPVESVNIRVGDRVTAGDLIATLDSSSLELQKATVEARIDMSRWVTTRRQTELELARQKEERFRQLRHSAATTEAQLEDAEFQLEIANQALGEARAAAQQIERELDIANYNISLTQIVAPYSGVIVERNIEIGQYVRVGDRVVRIIGDHELEIEAYIPYRYIDALTVGDTLNAQFDNGTQFDVTLRAFIPEEHVSTRTRAVRFTFDPTAIDDVLAVNQNVIIQVAISKQSEALTLHKDAIITNQDGYVVYVVKDGIVESRPVTLGDATGGRYQVESGLAEGEIIVIRGNERLQPGQSVRIIN